MEGGGRGRRGGRGNDTPRLDLVTCANMCYGFDGFIIRVNHGLRR